MNQNSAADQAHPEGIASSEAEPTGVDDPILRDEHEFLHAFINASQDEARTVASYVRDTDFHSPMHAALWRAAIVAPRPDIVGVPGEPLVMEELERQLEPGSRHLDVAGNALVQVAFTDAPPAELPMYTHRLLAAAVRREAFVFADRARQVAELTDGDDIYNAIAKFGMQFRDGARVRLEAHSATIDRHAHAFEQLAAAAKTQTTSAAGRDAATAPAPDTPKGAVGASHRVKAALGAAAGSTTRRPAGATVHPLEPHRRARMSGPQQAAARAVER